MQDTKNKAKAWATGVAAAFALNATSAQAQSIPPESVEAAFKAVYPYSVMIDKKSLTQAQRERASDLLIEAQRKITNLFGDGAEGQTSFNYHGKTLRASFDCDMAFITVGRSGFNLNANPKFIEGLHGAINSASDYIDQRKEAQMMAVSASAMMPLSHPKAQELRQHLFSPSPGENYKSAHNVDYSVVNTALETACKSKLDEANKVLFGEVMPKLQREGYFQTVKLEPEI